MIKYIALLLFGFLTFFSKSASAQTIYLSAGPGDWSVIATWSQVQFVPFFAIIPATATPVAGDQAFVQDGHAVIISGAEACAIVGVSSNANPASIVVNVGASLTCDSLTLNPSSTGLCTFTNGEDVTAIKIGLLPTGAASSCIFNNDGTVVTATTALVESSGSATINLNGGTRYTTTDVEVTNTAATNTVIDMSTGNGVMRLLGEFNGSGLATFIGGTSGSRIEYRGTSAQTISTSNPNFTFDDIRVINSSGASLDGPITVANLNDELRTAGNGVINQAGFDITMTGRIFTNANGTFNADANINSANNITNQGTFNQTAGNISLGRDLVNSGTFNAFGLIDITRHFNNQAAGVFVSTGCNINVERNWINNGSYTYTTGDIVSLDGVGGNSNFVGSTEFYELNIDKAGRLATCGNGDIVDIKGILDIDNGTLRVNGTGVMTLLSDATGTANMDNIDAGSFTGDLVVRRFINKTVQGYITIASPVAGTTLNSWHDGGIGPGQELIFSGFTGADFPAFSFNNAYDYDETISGANRDDGFVAADNITNPTGVANGFKSHYVWADAVSYNMSVTGVPNTGSISIPLTFNAAGGATDDGWNLIGNPFPCTVDWEVINNSLVGVEDFYSVYSYETGNFASFEGGGVGGLNGGTRFIASCQGVWVQATANTNLTIDESAKSAGEDPTFIKSTFDMLRISISSNVNTYSDEAVVIVDSQYDNNTEVGDRSKWMTFDAVNSPTLYTETYDGDKMSVNKLSDAGDLDIPLMAVSGTGATGTYVLEFDYPATFMANSCIMLEDLHTSTLIDLRQTSSYSYVTSDTTTTPRFLIHLGKNFTAEPFATSCSVNSDGSIEINGDNISGSSFTLLDNSNNLIATEVASSTTIVFDNLASGAYYLVSDYVGNCGTIDTIAVEVEAVNNVSSDFEMSTDTVLLDVSNDVDFINNSNGITFSWTFGDGVTSSDQNPSHNYNTPGVYTVTLVSENALGCQETSVQTIVVGYSIGLSVSDDLEDNMNWFIDGQNLVINSLELSNSNILLQIFDVSGKLVTNSRKAANSGQVTLSINDLAGGSYIAVLSANGSKVGVIKFVK